MASRRRWLVAGLTFQLAADILETAITTSWDEVARLGAIAAIRTFLNDFLERDIGQIRRRPDVPGAGPLRPARRPQGPLTFLRRLRIWQIGAQERTRTFTACTAGT